MISQTTEYALRAMACLAYETEGLTPTPRLAKLTKVPSNYLAKVLQSLAQASLIEGRRGVGGGYRLAREASAISMLAVVNAIDPVQRITECPLGLPNHGPNLCPLHSCVDSAAAQIIETFGSTSLEQLVAAGMGSRPLCDVEMTEKLALTLDGIGLGTENGNGHANGGTASQGHAVASPDQPPKA
ncbi:MAG: Rrf2 family transcriptional regulator [Planctomycetota bacterium]